MEAEDELSHCEHRQVQGHKDVDKGGLRGKAQGLPGDGNESINPRKNVLRCVSKNSNKARVRGDDLS